MSFFPTAFNIVVDLEGGISDDPTDPGGLTKYGVSTRVYASNLALLPVAVRATFPRSVTDLTLDQARAYYRPLYWDAHGLDDLPPAIALLMFDAYVNGGDPVSWLQSAVPVADAHRPGGWGPLCAADLAAAVARGELQRIVQEFQSRHLAYHASLHRDADELGWARRDVAILLNAIGLAGGLINIAP